MSPPLCLARRVHSARVSTVRHPPAPSPDAPWPVARRIRARPRAPAGRWATAFLFPGGVFVPVPSLRRPRYYWVDASLCSTTLIEVDHGFAVRACRPRRNASAGALPFRSGWPFGARLLSIGIPPAVPIPRSPSLSPSLPHLAAGLARLRGPGHWCFPAPFISRGALLGPGDRCDPLGEMGGGVFLRSTSCGAYPPPRLPAALSLLPSHFNRPPMFFIVRQII